MDCVDLDQEVQFHGTGCSRFFKWIAWNPDEWRALVQNKKQYSVTAALSSQWQTSDTAPEADHSSRNSSAVSPRRVTTNHSSNGVWLFLYLYLYCREYDQSCPLKCHIVCKWPGLTHHKVIRLIKMNSLTNKSKTTGNIHSCCRCKVTQRPQETSLETAPRTVNRRLILWVPWQR